MSTTKLTMPDLQPDNATLVSGLMQIVEQYNEKQCRKMLFFLFTGIYTDLSTGFAEKFDDAFKKNFTILLKSLKLYVIMNMEFFIMA